MPRGRPKKIKLGAESPVSFKVTFRYPTGDISHEVPIIEEGLAKLDLSKAIKGKVIIQVDYQGKHSELQLYPMLCKRVILNRVYRQLLAKRLMILQE